MTQLLIFILITLLVFMIATAIHLCSISKQLDRIEENKK
jgi:hypothetical protein